MVYTILDAATPEQALALAHGRLVDLLLTDLVLPGMNGVELYHALQTHHARLSVLYITGYSPADLGRRSGAPIPAGRLLTPGHAIEAGWFLLDHAASTGDAALRARALETIDIAWEAGWDGELGDGRVGAPAREAAADACGEGSGAGSGGMIYFRDALGFSPTALEAHMKLWWPQAEAMIAFAKAFEATLDARHLAAFDRVAAWTYAHLVTEREWYGYADRAGAVTHRFKGGPYKGCFHVPRAVLFCERALTAALAAIDARDAAAGASTS
jgi:N-acylglucosamine 2-epimerase